MRRTSQPRRSSIANAIACLVLVASAAFAAGGQAPPATPAPATAETVLSTALKKAAADRKVVLIEFGASWCTWCRRFEAFVRAPELSSLLASNYIITNLVVQEREDKKALENRGAQALMDKWGGSKSGLPFYVFLDASGRKLADSNAMPDGTNVGFPGTPEEARIFLTLLEKTAPRLGKADRAKIAGYLQRAVKK
jgi:thiol:disulfide interchange protein